MTEKHTEGRDERELAEDLEPTDEAAQDVTGGTDGRVNISEITIQKVSDKASTNLWK